MKEVGTGVTFLSLEAKNNIIVVVGLRRIVKTELMDNSTITTKSLIGVYGILLHLNNNEYVVTSRPVKMIRVDP